MQSFQVVHSKSCGHFSLYLCNHFRWYTARVVVISAFICAIISGDTQQELWSFQPLSVQSFQVVHSKSCGHFSLYLCNHFRWYTARVVVISAFICAIISGGTQQELWSFQPLSVQSFQVTHSKSCGHFSLYMCNHFRWHTARVVVISAFICAIISGDTQQELWSFQPLSVQSFQVIHSKSCGHFSLYLCNHFRWYTARVVVISAFICAIISGGTQQELWSFQPLSVQSFQVIHSKSCGHFSLYLCNHFRWYTARVVVILAFICAIISGDTQQELWSF